MENQVHPDGSPPSTICPSCKQDNAAVVDGINNHMRTPKGPDKPWWSNNIPMYVQKQQSFNLSGMKLSARNKKKDLAEFDEDIIGDTYVSDEFHQCEIGNNADYNNIIMRSCDDLAIDG